MQYSVGHWEFLLCWPIQTPVIFIHFYDFPSSALNRNDANGGVSDLFEKFWWTNLVDTYILSY